MLYLRTGKPGASKSLNTVREVTKDYDGSREKYYANIKLMMLDYDVCNSFSGWFYGWYWPRLKDRAARRILERQLKRIHNDDRFIEEDDAPWLVPLYEAHNSLDTWLYWVTRVYDKSVVRKVEERIELAQQTNCHYFDFYRSMNLHWTKFDDPKGWYDLPRQSIIIIDECQQFFPTRSVGSKRPAYASEMETHRHKGWDIHLISQDPRLVDADIRRHVNRHYHYHNSFGGKSVGVLKWSTVKDPSSYHDKKEASKAPIMHDKRFYGVYWSSELHTHKFKAPKAFYILGLLMLVLGYSIYNLSTGVLAKDKPKPQAQESAKPKPSEPQSEQPFELKSAVIEIDGKEHVVTALNQVIQQQLAALVIDGSLKVINTLADGTRQVNYQYSFSRPEDGAIFDPVYAGLDVIGIDSCKALLKGSGFAHVVTCNPFYIPQIIEDDSETVAERRNPDAEANLITGKTI